MPFVVLEGIDGAGKGTQVERLYAEMKKRTAVVKTREPTRGEIGELIRKYLRGENPMNPEILCLLFAADRYDNLNKTVIPALKRGNLVISERYVYSSIAYQSVQGMDPEWICTINRFAIPPDIVILLDIDPEIAISRITSKKEYFERKKVLQAVREKYLKIAEFSLKSSNYDFLSKTKIVIVDGSMDEDEIFKKIMEEIEKLGITP
ncbi:MAG: dTMP kinase [Candidatus Syntropharchaeia archaeon]